MSYLVPFQSVALFENTFRHQINKKTGKIPLETIDKVYKFSRTVLVFASFCLQKEAGV